MRYRILDEKPVHPITYITKAITEAASEEGRKRNATQWDMSLDKEDELAIEEKELSRKR